MDEETVIAILGLTVLVIVFFFIILGILTIIWAVNTIGILLNVSIPWYVYLFFCCAFVLRVIKVAIKIFTGE